MKIRQLGHTTFATVILVAFALWVLLLPGCSRVPVVALVGPSCPPGTQGCQPAYPTYNRPVRPVMSERDQAERELCRAVPP